MKLIDRIEKNIVRIPFAGCWIWTGAGNRYGDLRVNGKNRKTHRLIWELTNGEIPKGIEIMHSCDIGLCVNPEHLSVGTHQDNMTDMKNKGRARTIHGDQHWTRKDPERAKKIARQNMTLVHGFREQNPNAKVTEHIANSIRTVHTSNPKLRMVDIGSMFGIGREQTRKIVRGIAWKPQ